MPGRLLLLAAMTVAAWAQTPPAAETCGTCHEDVAKAFTKVRHAKQDCVSCHTGGATHAESAEAKDITKPSDPQCLGCHRTSSMQVHMRGRITCRSCHAVHDVKQAAKAQCATCHVSTVAEFAKPHRHRTECVSCHTPHGRPRVNEPSCINCHGDKRGPFAFEHAPVKLSKCSTCHEPHGSANPRMLVRHEVRLVCLECHSNIGARQAVLGTAPPAFHDLLSPRYRNCTVCHVRTHGSHADRAFLR